MRMSDNRGRYAGLIAATFTPMNPDGSLNLPQIGPMTERLINQGIRGVYVCGSTGEGVSLTVDERKQVAQEFVSAAASRIPVIVQVGHESINQARELAQHAQTIGADAISAIPPTYFRPGDLTTVVACSREIASAAPELDFFYYHIPSKTRVELDVSQLVERCLHAVPTFAGVKYSDTRVFELEVCVDKYGQDVTLLFGTDEMLLSGLVAGAHGAVGSTYNFLPGESCAIVTAFERNQLGLARNLQRKTALMISELNAIGGLPALKAAMGASGIECGPTRLPLSPLDPQKVAQVRRILGLDRVKG